MKTLIFIVTWISVNAFAHNKLENPIHLMPDATSADYQNYIESHFMASDILAGVLTKTPVDLAQDMGTRNLDWLQYMNSFRAEGNKIALTRPGDLKGHPIDKPNRYSPAIIEKTYNQVLKDMPACMYDVLVNKKDFTQDPCLDLETYVVEAKKVDKLYQTATRWKLTSVMLPYYKSAQEEDIRGIYFLIREPQLIHKLTTWSEQDIETQNRLRPYLENICVNSDGIKGQCAKKVNTAETENRLVKFYMDYAPAAEELFQSYFDIPEYRSDIKWTQAEPNKTVVPFRHTTLEVENFLKLNIEDEWKWNDWQLTLDFKDQAAIHVKFKSGVTPHVNKVAGSIITMDKNAPLTEWDVQWTIRHEFGHVLGFVDCYVEFYEESTQEMVNYQIDTSNLMCSRMGRLKQIHFDEFKRVYYKN